MFENYSFYRFFDLFMSGGELLEIWLLDTFGSKSTAQHEIDQLQIQLILAQLDSSSWQKKWQMVDTFEQLTLLSSVTYKLKKSIFYL